MNANNATIAGGTSIGCHDVVFLPNHRWRDETRVLLAFFTNLYCCHG